MARTPIMARFFARLWGWKDADQSYRLLHQARRELALDRPSLDRLILRRLQRIVAHAEQHCPYYVERFRENNLTANELQSLDDLHAFPVVDKEDLRTRLTDFLAGGKIDKSWHRSATGGTTSSPVTFYCDQQAFWHKNAATYAMDAWFGYRIGDRIVYLWGAPQDLPEKDSLGQWLRRVTYQKRLMLPSAPLNEEILAEHCRQIERWRPTFLQAYPTPLYELCLFMRENGISFPSLEAASVTAEPLHPQHRETIEQVLGVQVFNWYGSRELARVASECAYHDGMHINEPSVYVEIQEEPGLPAGCGRLVVTDLRNMATPLIRYRTDDVARWLTGSCACGRALKRIATPEGRLVDMIELASGKKIPGVSLTNRIIKDCAAITEMQIVQQGFNRFLVRYVKGPAFSGQALTQVHDDLCTLLDEQVAISFEEVPRVEREPSGKVRFVINAMPTDNRLP